MVKIITQNVKGIRDRNKRRAIFLHFRKKADIVCLQETHSDQESVNTWSLEWNSENFWSHGDSNARGVGILVGKQSGIELVDHFANNDGRIVGIQYKEKGELFCLINVYAPNQDDPNFFVSLFSLFESHEGKRILVGDFNTVLDKDLDRSNPNSANNDKATEIINKYIEDTLMCDIWRARNEAVKKYTYCRARPRFIGSRIDYILTEASLASWIENVKIVPGFRSDHSAISISILPFEIKRGRGLWKLNSQVLYEREYLDLINKVIDENIEINSSHKEKWEMIKLKVIANSQTYCYERASNRKLILSQLEEMIERYEKKQEADELNDRQVDIYQKSKKDFEELMNEKARGAIFRSGASYYNEGELPTKYFYSLEKNRSGAKNISCLLKDNGQLIYKPEEILREQRKFYKKLYTSEATETLIFKNKSEIRLDSQMKKSLEGSISMDKATKAIKSLNKNSSPGADGLTTLFYIFFWNKIKKPLVEAINESYNTGKLYPSALKGIVNLIPKRNQDTRKIEGARPISLLNTDYKILEKVLALRLKSALDFIINEDQKGFMTSRRISSNIRRIFDMMEYTEQNKIPGVILSIDFYKCFDRIEIPALLAAMKHFNIGHSFRKWTSLLYNGATACIINNGYFSEFYDVTRSVKQGGPCSAYFFLILAEVLAIEIRKNPNIKGILVNDIEKILGQYADDIDMYLFGETKNIEEAFRTISTFERSTGFKINYNKTTIYRIGSIKQSIAKLYTKKEIVWPTDKINVLGVWVTKEKSEACNVNYAETMSKVKATLETWKKRSLSLFGKILIVNSLVGSLFVYKMTVLPKIPKHTVNAFNKLISAFIWNDKRPKIPLALLQANKDEGGLGLVNLEQKDRSLKIGWLQIIASDTLIKQFCELNLESTLGQDIWKCNINSADVIKNFKDTFWRDVLEAWSKINYIHEPEEQSVIASQFLWLNSHIKSNGNMLKNVKAYKEGLTCVAQLYSPQGEVMSFEFLCKMFNLMIMEINQIFAALPRNWKKQMSSKCDFIVEYQYQQVITKKHLVSFSYKKLNYDDAYIRHSLTKWLRNTRIEIELGDYCQLFNNIYSITNNAKLRSFQYRVLNCALVLNTHLFKWKMKKSDKCEFCTEKQTLCHLMWECEKTQEIWKWFKTHLTTYKGLNINEYTICKQTVLCNNIHDKASNLANFLCLVVKNYLYACKCKGKPYNSFEIKARIDKFQEYEYYFARKNDKLSSHMKKWCIFDTQQCITYNGTNLSNDYVMYYLSSNC